MSQVAIAATQMTCSWELDQNVEQAVNLVKQAAKNGAQIVLLQELFETPYFCIEQNNRHYELATTLADNKCIDIFIGLAKQLKVVIPFSWFERAGKSFFNSMAMIDADGTILGVYRKSHIPNSIGYQEKTYFSPGNTGFKIWNTKYASVGVGICWDQWFPEAARCMALKGAEILMYPTAIGSEPGDPGLDSMEHWRNVMCGHAGANIIPVVASNRIGKEHSTCSNVELTFYGTSFLADHIGNVIRF